MGDKTERAIVLRKNRSTSKDDDPSNNGFKTQDQIWREREKRLEELLEKEGENPEAKEDFNRLLRETVRQNSR